MSVKQRFNWLDNQRVDKPHLKSIDDSVIFDFKTLLQAFQNDTPYILRGFDIQNPGAAINAPASNLQIVVDSGIIWAPNQIDGPYLRVPQGTLNETLNTANPKVIGSFTANATNYISIQLKRATDDSTSDLVAFWDVDSATEFTKTVPTGLVLNYEFVINTSGFGSNIPLAIVVTDAANNVLSITNAKRSLFRLGTGGSNPNPNYTWSYNTNPENPLTLTTSGGPSPFAGGDWEIKTFKDWMDAVMSEIKLMKGSSYWYSNGSSNVSGVNLTNVWFDALGSVISGVGRFVHSDATPGQISWSSDIFIKSVTGPLTYTIPAGSVTLSNGQVAYITLEREVDFQPANNFTFTNSSTTVTATAPITGISAGDWIKFHGHDLAKYAKVASVSGTTITLSSPYAGASAIGKAVKAKGTYTVSVAHANSIPSNADVYWLARREDNFTGTATIAPPASSGATRTSDIATITTTAPHGFVVGQTVSISGVSIPSFDAVAEILSVPSSTTFTYLNPGTNVGAGLAGNGTVSARAKIYLRAIGEIDQGEERQIDDNTTQNILRFIGSESETDITPPYSILPNTLSPYTFTGNSNLTQAISAITGNVNSILTVLDQPAYDETIEIVSGGTSVVQAQNTTGGGPGNTIQASAEMLGQSFTATASNFLTDIVWRLRSVGSPDANIVCDICVDSSGQPGAALATSLNSIAATSLTGSYANYTFNFAPVPLTTSTIYWIVLRVTGVVTLSGTDYIDAEDSNTNPYASGVEAKYNGTTWTAIPGSDFRFVVNSLTLGPNQWPPMPANTVITIPKNSRLTGTPQQHYIVSKGTLQVYLNGQYLRLGATNGWDEVGTPLSNSSKIQIKQALVAGDEIIFRIDGTGGPGSGGGSAPDDDFVTLPEESGADNNDFVLIYDVSANAYKKQKRSNFLAGLSSFRVVNTFNTSGTLTSAHDHVRVDCTGGSVTLTLPPAALNIGLQYTIKKIDSSANSVILNPGSDTIDGATSLSWNTPYQSYTIIAAASGQWDIV